jgi:hypothetical protein
MPMICNLTKGATVTTHSGKAGLFERLEGDRVVVRVPDGLKRIPLSAIAHWELPEQFPVGSIVHKRFNDGWTGIVRAIAGSGKREVLWWLDAHPSLMDVDDLRAANDAIARGYQKAFITQDKMP